MGITWGRCDFKIERQQVCIKELPDSFNGFRIVQLTDLHLGSYGEHYPGVKKLVDEVNTLNPDLIVFTGDMVNSFASEMDPWIEQLKKLKAKHGVYSSTGNHDYGTYVRWATPEEQKNNLKQFFINMETAGFHMLNNTNVPLVIGTDTIYLTGVENCGRPLSPASVTFRKPCKARKGTGDSPLPRPVTLAGRGHPLPRGSHAGRTYPRHANRDTNRQLPMESVKIRLPGIQRLV